MLEQVAQIRDAAQQWNLINTDRVLGLDDATNHYRPAVGDQDLRSCLLRDQRRVALHCVAKVR